MAVCKTDVLAMGKIGRESAGFERVGAAVNLQSASAKPPQRVTLSANTVQRRLWPSVVSVRAGAQPSAKLRLRCNASPDDDNDGQPTKDYDIAEVIEKVAGEEANQLPEDAKGNPEPLPEGEPAPNSPAIDMDNLDALQGKGVSKDSLVEPPRAVTQESAASSSIGEGLGVSEHSALSADPVGKSSGGRDWRLYSSDGNGIGQRGDSATVLNAKVEEASDTRTPQEHKHKQMFGPSESSCDEGSSFLAMAGILENEGGKSVDDYKLRADIFSESAVFFTALKNRDSHSVV